MIFAHDLMHFLAFSPSTSYISGKPFTLLTMGGMYLDLRELLGREVDLVEEGSLRPYAVDSVERDKQLIYERKS